MTLFQPLQRGSAQTRQAESLTPLGQCRHGFGLTALGGKVSAFGDNPFPEQFLVAAQGVSCQLRLSCRLQESALNLDQFRALQTGQNLALFDRLIG